MQLIANYLIVFCSLLQSNLLVFTVWFKIVAEVSHYRSSPIFPFDNVDGPGLWWDCLDRSIFGHLEKYVIGHQDVAGCSFCQFISFANFVSPDVLYCEYFEIIFYSSHQTQIPLEGWFPGNSLFFYLSSNHFRISAEDGFLNSGGS
jgi:hypothetical protein